MRQKSDRKKNFKKMRNPTSFERKVNKVENFIYELKEEITSWFAVTIFGIVIFTVFLITIVENTRSLFGAKKIEEY